MLIGMPVNEFNENKDLEVITFRRNILKGCKDIVDQRDKGGAHMRALYAYSPEIESSSQLPPHLFEKLKKFTDGMCLQQNNKAFVNLSLFFTIFSIFVSDYWIQKGELRLC